MIYKDCANVYHFMTKFTIICIVVHQIGFFSHSTHPL